DVVEKFDGHDKIAIADDAAEGGEPRAGTGLVGVVQEWRIGRGGTGLASIGRVAAVARPWAGDRRARRTRCVAVVVGGLLLSRVVGIAEREWIVDRRTGGIEARRGRRIGLLVIEIDRNIGGNCAGNGPGRHAWRSR